MSSLGSCTIYKYKKIRGKKRKSYITLKEVLQERIKNNYSNVSQNGKVYDTIYLCKRK